MWIYLSVYQDNKKNQPDRECSYKHGFQLCLSYHEAKLKFEELYTVVISDLPGVEKF